MNKEAGVGAPLMQRQLIPLRMCFVLIAVLQYETFAVRQSLVMELSNSPVDTPICPICRGRNVEYYEVLLLILLYMYTRVI